MSETATLLRARSGLEARITDAAGKLCATASTICLVFDLAESTP